MFIIRVIRKYIFILNCNAISPFLCCLFLNVLPGMDNKTRKKYSFLEDIEIHFHLNNLILQYFSGHLVGRYILFNMNSKGSKIR